MDTFKNGQPEEFLALLNNFKIVIDGTGTTSVKGRINYLHRMLRAEALIKFDELTSQNCGTTNAHPKHITEGLLGYSPLINALSNQKRVMRRTMNETRKIMFKNFDAQLTGINNYMPHFPGSIEAKKMGPEELNKILLHAVTNGCTNQSYLQVWDDKLRCFHW